MSIASPPPEVPTRRDAKAELKAAKAYSKAQRPWYKKKRWIVSLGLLLLVMGSVGANSGGGDEEPTSASGGGTSASSEGSNPSSDGGDDGKSGSVGQAITNAGTTYEVTNVETADTIGGDPEFGGGGKAAGTFVIVDLSLTNNKDETKTFTDSSAKIETADGKSYDTTNDSLYLGEDNLLIEEIQPDLTTTGKLAFDLPPSKVSGSTLIIEDLFGKGEIKVALGL